MLILFTLYNLCSKNAGFVDIADMLVKSKANLNIENKNGDTPLKAAKSSGLYNLDLEYRPTFEESKWNWKNTIAKRDNFIYQSILKSTRIRTQTINPFDLQQTHSYFITFSLKGLEMCMKICCLIMGRKRDIVKCMMIRKHWLMQLPKVSWSNLYFYANKKSDFIIFVETWLILGNFKRVNELVKIIDVNKQNNVGDTALIRACETGKNTAKKYCKCILYDFSIFFRWHWNSK